LFNLSWDFNFKNLFTLIQRNDPGYGTMFEGSFMTKLALVALKKNSLAAL